MAQLIGIDEYGRPIIVMKGQENQERLTGVAALKVSFQEKEIIIYSILCSIFFTCVYKIRIVFPNRDSSHT